MSLSSFSSPQFLIVSITVKKIELYSLKLKRPKRRNSKVTNKFDQNQVIFYNEPEFVFEYFTRLLEIAQVFLG